MIRPHHIFLLALASIVACQRSSDKSSASDTAGLSDSALVSLYDHGLLSRDSLLAILSSQGRLGVSSVGTFRPPDYNSSPSQDAIAQGVRFTSVLRSKLKYPFALDYVVSHQDSVDFGRLNPGSLTVIPSTEPFVLEEFDLFQRNTLYRVQDFRGTSQFYLISQNHGDGFYTLSLFSTDSLPVLLDKKEIGRSASFEFDTLNRGLVVNLDFRTWGTGYVAEHIEFFTIDEGRFKVLFSTYTSIVAGHPWSIPSSKTIGDVQFVDLNNDGFLDVQNHVTVFTIADSTLEYWDDDVPNSKFRDLTRSFIWRPDQVTFVEEVPHQL